MKKILSIFSIGAVLGSGTILSGGGIACNSSTPPQPTPSPTPTPGTKISVDLNKFVLDKIAITSQSTPNSFSIVGSDAYKSVEDEIIKKYNAIVPDKKLNENNFELNSTTLKDKSWAIQILGLDGTTPINDSKTASKLVVPSNFTNLTNNALKVKILTNNKFVVATMKKKTSKATTINATVNGYLDKFIYTNKNLNQGNEVSANTSLSVSENNLIPSNVINFQTGPFSLGFNINSFNTTQALKTAILGISNAKKALISKAIVSNLNSQLKNEITKPDGLGILKSASNNIGASKPADIIPFTSGNVSFFKTVNNSSVVSFATLSNLNTLEKVFVRIQIPSTYKYLQNYLGTSNSYVYGYLGTINQNAKLSLNNLVIKNININSNQSNFEINGQTAYNNVANQIIAQYKTIFPDSTLALASFKMNSVSIGATKSWAIQIYNVDNASAITTAQNQALVFPSTYKYLPNNALSVKITTNDVNVVINSSNSKTTTKKTATIQGYLNKFIYTNTNANNGINVNVTAGQSATQNNLLDKNVIDLSSSKYNLNINKLLKYNTVATKLTNVLFNLNQNQRALISKTIVTNLNSRLINETAKLNMLGDLTIASNDVSASNALEINDTTTNLFAVKDDDSVAGLDLGEMGAGWKIFAQINISGWNYLNHYLTNNNSFVYAYIGSVSNEAKFNLQNLAIYNIGDLTQTNDEIQINGVTAYKRVVDQIVTQVNRYYWWSRTKQISSDDFALNTLTLSAGKTWAIQLDNGNTHVLDAGSTNLGITSNEGLASNKNSLTLRIVTSDANVLNNTSTNNVNADLDAYLNQFVYNTTDANNNQNLAINHDQASPGVTQATTIDFSGSQHHLVLGNNTSASALLTSLKTQSNLVELSNDVINHVNNGYDLHVLDSHLQTLLPKVDNLGPLSPFVIPTHDSLFKLYIRLATDPVHNYFISWSGTREAGPNRDVFLQLKVSTWNLLTNHHYISIDSTYVYFYIGTTPTS